MASFAAAAANLPSPVKIEIKEVSPTKADFSYTIAVVPGRLPVARQTDVGAGRPETALDVLADQLW